MFVLSKYHPDLRFLRHVYVGTVQQSKSRAKSAETIESLNWETNRPARCCSACMMTILPLSVLALQVFLLLATTYQIISKFPAIQNAKPWPHENATIEDENLYKCAWSLWPGTEKQWIRKLVASSILGMYTIHYCLYCMDVFFSTLHTGRGVLVSKNFSDDKMVYNLPTGSFLKYRKCDWYCSFFINKFSVALNVLILMTTADVVDIVLNSLAVIWISKLDDTYKEKVLGSEHICR